MGAQEKTPAGQISFTYCKNFATAETKSATWAQFAATAAKSVGYDTKDQSIRRAAIVGGVRSDERSGRADNVKSRTMLTLDYDKAGKIASQEGRTRSFSAIKAGIDEVPVLVVNRTK